MLFIGGLFYQGQSNLYSRSIVSLLFGIIFVSLSVENSRIVLIGEQPDYIHAVATNVKIKNFLILI